GTSIRDDVLMGASSDQSLSVQYALMSRKRVTSMSTNHLVADTNPYSPGTTMRTGNPCSKGSGSPFIAMASIASRSSVSAPIGVPIVMSSALVDSTASADGSIPMSASSSLVDT